MTLPKVQTAPTPSEPLTGYAATAAELRRIADALDSLPREDPRPPYSSLSILPRTAADVNIVGRAVLGASGTTEAVGASWQHKAEKYLHQANMTVRAMTTVSKPPDERDEELAELRAELAQAELERDQARGTA